MLDFKEEVAKLKNQLSHFRACDSPLIPASRFCSKAQEIWENIKDNKDLDVPAFKVLVDEAHCELIAGEKLDSFSANEHVKPTYENMLKLVSSETLDKFVKAFDEASNEGEELCVAESRCKELFLSRFDQESADAMIRQANWETSGVKDELEFAMNKYVKLRELASKYEKSEAMTTKALKTIFSMSLTAATGGIPVVALVTALDKIKKLLDCVGDGDWQDIGPQILEILTDFVT